MYLWRRSATREWLGDKEDGLRAAASDQLAIIERPNRKHLQIEVAAKRRARLQKLAKEFGGRIEKLPRDWLERSLRRKTKPLRIGNKTLVIPAAAAFGTGEHATTAMCMRLLEKIMRTGRDGSPSRPKNLSDASEKRPYHSVVDLGTGSGILALAAKLLGARRAIGIDNDPVAVSTAKQNARLNKIRGVKFEVRDVRHWKIPRKIDIVTANLFSELLIGIVPKLKTTRWLILSGILRKQEKSVMRVLKQNKIDLVQVRRRGKWVAILARRSN